MQHSPILTQSIEQLLEKMWTDYIHMNPNAKRIYDLFTALGEQVVNDHIALRTFALPQVNLQVLERPFLSAGYVPKGDYLFPEKKLQARHYEAPGRPKIFISQLQVDKLDLQAQRLIHDLVEPLEPSLCSRFDFCSIGRPWELSYSTYQSLRQHSEYAAWVAAFGYRPNHFTVDINSLSKLPSIQKVNEFLRENGFQLNSVGGEIKGSPEALLEQSSTIANNIDVLFSDGLYRIPACYYEFAKRYPSADGSLYQGFIAASADKIFQSTDQGQEALA